MKYARPSSHRIDPASGDMRGASGCYEKRIGDLKGLYATLMRSRGCLR